jgi:16S rRNA (guanine(966)-N(2))-methyltransferase RsmD
MASSKPRKTAHQAPAHSAAPGKLRIVGGVFKRTPLPIATVEGLRPTPERLRETLFNWLGGDLTGWRCLDLFAGTGALGFEAASRGASFVLLNDANKSAYTQLQKNAALLKTRQGAEHLELQVRCQDGIALLQSGVAAPFDVIFLDPPFAQDKLYLQAISAIKPVNAAWPAIYLEANKAWNDAESAVQLADLGWRVAKHSKVGAVHGHVLEAVQS